MEFGEYARKEPEVGKVLKNICLKSANMIYLNFQKIMNTTDMDTR